MLNVTYDPTTINYTTSPYGYAYNHISLGLTSDAGNLLEWHNARSQASDVRGIAMKKEKRARVLGVFRKQPCE